MVSSRLPLVGLPSHPQPKRLMAPYIRRVVAERKVEGEKRAAKKEMAELKRKVQAFQAEFELAPVSGSGGVLAITNMPAPARKGRKRSAKGNGGTRPTKKGKQGGRCPPSKPKKKEAIVSSDTEEAVRVRYLKGLPTDHPDLLLSHELEVLNGGPVPALRTADQTWILPRKRGKRVSVTGNGERRLGKAHY